MDLNHLFANNRRWAEQMERRQPGFFAGLTQQQAPEFLWIGCSDSRVPANEIVGLAPGELFVHRNVANLIKPNDLNCMAVVHYAVEALKVRHIIVCGHYGCGGVEAAMQVPVDRPVDRWLSPLRTLIRMQRTFLSPLSGPDRLRRCCELNVIEQVRNLTASPPVQAAWQAGRGLTIHGWIYDIADGLLHDLGVQASSPQEAERIV